MTAARAECNSLLKSRATSGRLRVAASPGRRGWRTTRGARAAFIVVCANGFGERQSAAVMQKAAAQTNAPERRRAQFLRSGRAAVLDDAISRAHVVEQEVAVRMDDFVAEGVGNDERTAVDDRASRSGDDGQERGRCRSRFDRKQLRRLRRRWYSRDSNRARELSKRA